MMRPRWRKVISDLLGSKTRSLLVIASISVGLFAVGMIVNLYLILTQDMRTGYEAVNPANILVSTGLFDQDLVKHVQHVDGVAQVEGVFSFTLRVRAASGEWKPIDIQAIPKIADKQINRLRLLQGVWPPQDKELVVDRYKLGDLPAGVGGYVEIELPSGKTRMVKLVGVVNDQTIGSEGGGGFFLSGIQGYMTLDTMPWLELPASLNKLYVTVSSSPDDLDHLALVANAVSKAVTGSGRTVYSLAQRAGDNHPNRVYVQAIASVLIVLGFLVLFLSGFLITNTLSALLTQQVHQIGVMKMVGARRGQIIGIYMVQIFLFGLVAFAVALPLANWISYSLLQVVADQINITLQGFRVNSGVVILELVMALVVPQAAGFFPILNGTRITVVEALSGYSQSNPPTTGGLINRLIHNIRGLPRPILLSLRNTFRRRGRLILTLVTLTLGGAVFIATFSAQRSLADYIDQIGRYFLADVNVTLKQPARIDEIQRLVKEVPGVKGVETWAGSGAELVMPDGSIGEGFSLIGLPAGSKLVEPVLLAGRWLIPGDQNAVVLNENFRVLFPDMKPGDTLRARIIGKNVDLVVVGFFQMAGKSGGYLSYTTYDFLARQVHMTSQASTFRVTGSQAGMTLDQQNALGKAIETHLKDSNYVVGQIEAGHSLTATTANGLNILTAFLLVMALLTAVVGSIGLAGTMSMNVLERTREIGIIRAVGASDRSVINLVMVEGLLIGLMSWILGTLLSFPISYLLSNAINLALFGATANFTFSPIGVVLWLGVVLVLSTLASVIPARNAARLTIREVLSYE